MTESPFPTNATCPVCARPSMEDFDDDGTSYNHCVLREGCLAVYVSPPGWCYPTVQLPLWDDLAEYDAWRAEQWAGVTE